MAVKVVSREVGAREDEGQKEIWQQVHYSHTFFKNKKSQSSKKRNMAAGTPLSSSPEVLMEPL